MIVRYYEKHRFYCIVNSKLVHLLFCLSVSTVYYGVHCITAEAQFLALDWADIVDNPMP